MRYDLFCPLYKTQGLLCIIINFYKLALQVVSEHKNITWNAINKQMGDLTTEILYAKFKDPREEGKDAIMKHYRYLYDKITDSFYNLKLELYAIE